MFAGGLFILLESACKPSQRVDCSMLTELYLFLILRENGDIFQLQKRMKKNQVNVYKHGPSSKVQIYEGSFLRFL